MTEEHQDGFQYAKYWTHKFSNYTPHTDEGPNPYIICGRDTIPATERKLRDEEPSSVQIIITHNDGDTGKKEWKPTYMSELDFKLTATKLDLHINDAAIELLNTDIVIPDEIRMILSFGPKFSVPIPFDESKQVLLVRGESRLNKFHMSVYEQRAITQMAKEHIDRTRNHNSINRNPKDVQAFLIHCYKCVIRFFSGNEDHVIAQADKGNITIIMKRTEYIKKVEEHLADRSIYEMINTSSHVGYARRNEILLKRMADAQVISNNRIQSIVAGEDKIPNMYGLVKLHKEAKPIRPVVNTRSGPGYTLARILTDIFTKAQETHKYNVRNSKYVIDRLSYITPDPDEFFASFDITSMFTNITTDVAIACISKRFHAAKLNTVIPLETIIDATRFATSHATEIEFNGQIKKSGLRMGSSLSSILADFVTADILDSTFIRIERPNFFAIYFDDCLVLAKKGHFEEIGRLLNAANKHITFEMEKEGENGHIAYLDIDIHNTHRFDILTRWHQKPMASARLLNFRSTHPKATIMNTARC